MPVCTTAKKKYTCTCVPRVVMSKYGSAIVGWDFVFKERFVAP